MNIQPVFADFISNDFIHVDNAKIESYSYKLMTNNPGRSVSNFGGWQSALLDTTPELSELFDIVSTKFREVADAVGFSNLPLITDTAWININKKSDMNLIHSHPGSFLSAVYYVKAKPGQGDIVFNNPNSAKSYLVETYRANIMNYFNASTWSFTPTTGLLLIFPSWLYHFVLPNELNEDRISIAFNAGVKDKVH